MRDGHASLRKATLNFESQVELRLSLLLSVRGRSPALCSTQLHLFALTTALVAALLALLVLIAVLLGLLGLLPALTAMAALLSATPALMTLLLFFLVAHVDTPLEKK
jgi:hypothetical protein